MPSEPDSVLLQALRLLASLDRLSIDGTNVVGWRRGIPAFTANLAPVK